MSDLSLARKYRPAVFADVVGQPSAAVLAQMVACGKVPDALLFYGTRGSGKTSTARILAAALNCTGPGQPCNSCESCKAVREGLSPAVKEIDAASNGLVADVRDKLTGELRYSFTGQWRVVILDEAHSMSRDAFHALLKTLEEPPERTVFVLVTTDPGKVLPTVASRCLRFGFRPVAPAVVERRLAHVAAAEGIAAEPALLAGISARSGGGMRDALMALDQAHGAGITTLAAWEEFTGDVDFAPALLSAAASGDMRTVFGRLGHVLSHSGDHALALTRLTDCLVDVLTLSAGGTVAAQGEPLEARQALARRVGAGQAVAALRILWDLRTKVRAGSGASSFRLAAVLVAEALAPKPAGNGTGVLNVGEMRRLAGTL